MCSDLACSNKGDALATQSHGHDEPAEHDDEAGKPGRREQGNDAQREESGLADRSWLRALR